MKEINRIEQFKKYLDKKKIRIDIQEQLLKDYKLAQISFQKHRRYPDNNYHYLEIDELAENSKHR